MPQTEIRSIIIDDDPFIQDLLRDKLNQYFKEIEVCATADSGSEGIQAILSVRPDLVFLDVEMTDMTGFEMLSQLQSVDFKVIFITSYTHYAIKAIRFNALDYLLKPFDLEELKNAVARFKEERPGRIGKALVNMRRENVADQVLTLRTHQGDLDLKLGDIAYVEGERNYSRIHLADSRKEIVSRTLGSMEELLEDKGFFRCHKSYLVNRLHIASAKSESLTLKNGEKLGISRRKREEFNAWFHD